jgi:hypothetical protein
VLHSEEPWDPQRLRALIDSSGPWPSVDVDAGGQVLALDVDRYGGFPALLSLFTGVEGDTRMHEDIFQADGGWRWIGGGWSGGGRSPLVERRLHPWSEKELDCPGQGWIRTDQGGMGIKHAQILCSPKVAFVHVSRAGQERVADLRRRPGWIIVLWPDEIHPLRPPVVTAFDGSHHVLSVVSGSDFR